MSSTAANAATSRFLMLPIELRCRIYEHVFGNNVIHICPGLRDGDLASRYRLTVCDCPEGPDHPPPRLRLDALKARDSGYPVSLENHAQICVRTATHRDFSLGLLSVCRKIYHEAVLEPLQQTFFSQLTTRFSNKALAAFIDRLVPAQVKAITRLRQYVWASQVFAPHQLRGLKHLDLLLCCAAKKARCPDYQTFSSFWLGASEIKAIKKLGLESISLSIQFYNLYEEDRDREYQDLLEATDFVLGWLHNMENLLLGDESSSHLLQTMSNPSKRF
jgi:hypothetical protein